jgi:outer membrane biosynthesis protein TonB
MDYIAIAVSLIALIGAGFAFLRATSSHRILVKRIETLKDKNSGLEARLRKLEGNSGRGNRPSNETNESGRRNQPKLEQQQETRQNQPRQEQQEPRQKQPRQEQQSERRQKQRERQPQPQQQVSPSSQPEEEISQQPQQPRRKKENRRRNEPMERTDYDEVGREQPNRASNTIKLEIAGGDLLDELELAAGNNAPVNAPADTPFASKKYAIIPEDGVIRMHQLQQQPDSDSYIEVDMPAEGGNITNYRFNLAGNHAFVIAQGIDRLENAFDFEKPSNRMVTKVVQQHDGVLNKVNNGWRIQEKARIDFR